MQVNHENKKLIGQLSIIKYVEKREKYFEELRTTSHWPYPIKVNSLQPQTYGNKEMEIDYTKLNKPDLSKYMKIIKELI